MKGNRHSSRKEAVLGGDGWLFVGVGGLYKTLVWGVRRQSVI